MRRQTRLRAVIAVATGALVGGGLVTGGAASAAPAHPASHRSTGRAATGESCALGKNGRVHHVIYLQFDNVHLRRDNPNVPSDLEQMPHLLNFIRSNGTMLGNDHDVLVHTATNVTSATTGLYPDRHGVTQSNSFRYYNPDGKTNPGVSFTYWTDPVFDPSTSTPTDTKYNLIYSARPENNPTQTNVNVPAPWVPFTRAGCNVGDVAMNTALENTEVDIPVVFGAGSPEEAEAKANPDKAAADFTGLAVHCARGATPCGADNGAQPDLLPDEPGGYHGYRALFGNSFVQPAIHPSGPITSLSGEVIKDVNGNVGFPGFDSMQPDNALAYTADMQEHGVPVTYTYLSDAHDHYVNGNLDGFGPGEQGYVAKLKQYDDAFAAFFDRLRSDGITAANTLFVVTTDEGDHFVGSPPSPADCDGVTVPCSYDTKGEVNANLTGLLATQRGNTTPFTMHSDPAPAVYVTGQPDRSDPAVRQLERDTAAISVTNPLTGKEQQVFHAMADPVEEKILHFVSADGARTPTFTAFADQDFYVYGGAPNCSSPCVTEPPGYVWNHGSNSMDMANIFLGLAGPGVRQRGEDDSTWIDQTDVRPTMLSVLGLHDDYADDGRVIVEDVSTAAQPRSLREHRGTVLRLGRAYKQIEATVGQFGVNTLTASTRGIVSGSAADDNSYQRIEQRLQGLERTRASVAHQIRAQLLGAAFDGRPIDQRRAEHLLRAAATLLAHAHHLAYDNS